MVVIGFQRLKPFNTPDLKKQWEGLCDVAKKNIEVGLANANKLNPVFYRTLDRLMLW